ncbi:hypothetical protein GGI12_005335, partial [Dipsacomyces acuminosporus]
MNAGCTYKLDAIGKLWPDFNTTFGPTIIITITIIIFIIVTFAASLSLGCRATKTESRKQQAISSQKMQSDKDYPTAQPNGGITPDEAR